jgi:DNA-binding transcriptional LysR family regulator
VDPFAGVLAFCRVAEEQSFSKAAVRLGLTPAAVSKAVSRLERELGVRLLNRTTRRVALSSEGALYFAHCREALAELQAGRDVLAMAQRSASGELRVSLPFVLGRFVVSRLPRFLLRYPGLHVALHLTDRYVRLVDDAVDVAIRVGELSDSSLVARKLTETHWATLASPAYLARRGTPQSPEDLAKHNCLKFRSPRGRPVEYSFRTQGSSKPRVLAVSGNFEADQGELVLEAALAGAGVCQVFSYMAKAALRRGRLVELLRDHSVAGPPVHALYLPQQRRSAKLRAFNDFLREIFRGDVADLAQ